MRGAGGGGPLFRYQHEDRHCAAAGVLAGPTLKIVVEFSSAAAKRQSVVVLRQWLANKVAHARRTRPVRDTPRPFVRILERRRFALEGKREELQARVQRTEAVNKRLDARQAESAVN
jgi:hypothetical protein